MTKQVLTLSIILETIVSAEKNVAKNAQFNAFKQRCWRSFGGIGYWKLTLPSVCSKFKNYTNNFFAQLIRTILCDAEVVFLFGLDKM